MPIDIGPHPQPRVSPPPPPVPPDTTPILTILVLRRDVHQAHALSQHNNISIFNPRAQYNYTQQRSQTLPATSRIVPPPRSPPSPVSPCPAQPRLRPPGSSRSHDHAAVHAPHETKPRPHLREDVGVFYLIEWVCWTSEQRRLPLAA